VTGKPEETGAYLREALRLARRGSGRTSPNPLVGAVVVRGGQVIGAGYHQKAGGPHAERIALAQAGRKARGATLYVTLEPCNHTGRTPPCTEAILESGVKRVVFGMEDPNPRVAGGGGPYLRSRGISVTGGFLERECRALNEVYLKWVTTGFPFVTLKAALSLDGKIATRSGDSKWISNEQSRAKVHRLRSRVDGILVGIGTILADDPLLTPRLSRRFDRTPLRVIVDPHLKMPLTARLFSDPGPVLVAATEGPSKKKAAELRRKGVDLVLFSDQGGGRFDLKALLAYLGRKEVTSLLVEGGSEIFSSFLNAGLADRLWLFYAPLLIGGESAKGMIGGRGVATVAEALKFERLKWQSLGGDFFVEGYLKEMKRTKSVYRVD
jgi:diaminohydroxyphosphoribosylaminopyrimidine deaminase/5-amino-6-(5-phosphoribosylamino)uracil reductase